jgi:FAD/FMN-containing dehydrogenase
MPHYSRRSILKAGATLGVSATLPLASRAAELRTIVNDASLLNPTPVARHLRLKPDATASLIERLRAELREARAERRPVAVGVARHSMGGQSLPRDGVAVTLAGGPIEVDTQGGICRMGAGVTWAQVIRKLDPLGLSPAVMQSNNDFGVGSTFCVNAHGWPTPYGPFGSTVRSLRILLADGSLVTCSRDENVSLFSLAMGGYGLFGIIIDLDVEITRNLLLAPRVQRLPADQFAAAFVKAIEADRQVRMAYGRLSVARGSFFEDALLVTYRPVARQPETLPRAVNAGMMTSVSRDIYPAQVGSEAAKWGRWFAETRVNPAITSGIATRNSLMNEPVSNLRGRDRRRTDILHEYFIPPEQFRHSSRPLGGSSRKPRPSS